MCGPIRVQTGAGDDVSPFGPQELGKIGASESTRRRPQPGPWNARTGGGDLLIFGRRPFPNQIWESRTIQRPVNAEHLFPRDGQGDQSRKPTEAVEPPKSAQRQKPNCGEQQRHDHGGKGEPCPEIRRDFGENESPD
jgi:hypothetical protein